MKKLLCAFLSCAMLLTVLVGCNTISDNNNDTLENTESGTNTEPQDTAHENELQESPASDFEYEILDNDTISITKYIGSAKNIIIPSTIENKEVCEIGSEAFRDYSTLNYISFPENIYKINEYAFYNSGVVTIEFNDGIQYIGDAAFANTNIKNILLPSTVKEIGWFAFANCNLETIKLNDGLTTIQHEAFKNTNIADIVIPRTVKTIYETSFTSCEMLKTVTFEGDAPKSYIYKYATPYLGAGDVEYTVYYHPNANGFDFPTWNGYQTQIIGEASFSMPIFDNFKYLETDEGISIFSYIGTKSDVVIPNTINGKPVTKILPFAFKYNNQLITVKIPDTVTEIGNSAFANCNLLTSVEMSQNIQIIGDGAFMCCYELSDISLYKKLTDLGEGAFYYCKNLKQITVPSSVLKWGAYAFGYSGLNTVNFELGLASIGIGAFSNTKLIEVTIPKSVYLIEQEAFLSCTELNSVILNDGLKVINAYAFTGCLKLKEIIIPSTVTDITTSVFDYCYGLKAVKFSGNAPKSYISITENNKDSNLDYTVYYHLGADGFTSPTWNGFPTEIW